MTFVALRLDERDIDQLFAEEPGLQFITAQYLAAIRSLVPSSPTRDARDAKPRQPRKMIGCASSN